MLYDVSVTTQWLMGLLRPPSEANQLAQAKKNEDAVWVSLLVLLRYLWCVCGERRTLAGTEGRLVVVHLSDADQRRDKKTNVLVNGF